jgi:phosphate-selective porin
VLIRTLAVVTSVMLGLPAAAAAQILAVRGASFASDANALNVLAVQQAQQPADQGVRFVWGEHPSLRFGRALRLDFVGRFQEDGRKPGDSPLLFETWELHRLRAGIEGEIFNRVQFSIEREFYERENRDGDDEGFSKTLWKDVYVDANLTDALQVRAGRFKIPFGGEQLTGISNIDFVYRSLGATYLSPSRDIGAALHGNLFDDRINYWAGVFEHDGDNSRSRRIEGGDETFAARVTAQTWNQNNGPGLLEFSGAFMRSAVSDESVLPNGLRGRTAMSQFVFYEPVFVKGNRSRFEADVDYMAGPFSARAEYTWMTDQRLEQGFGSDDLPDARARAWYVSGTWVITGERKDRPVEPGRWFGALEAAARIEQIRFSGATGDDIPFRNPRAITIFPVANDVATVGLNWYVNRWVKLQVNAIREEIDDIERNPILSGGAFWSRVLRLHLLL